MLLTVRNELADHLNQKGIYRREPLVPTTEPASVTASMDDLEQILSDVGIAAVHTIADPLDNTVPPQIAAATFAQTLSIFSQYSLYVAYTLAHLPEGNERDRESPLTAIVKAVGADLLDDVEPDISPSTSLQATVETSTSPGLRRIGPGRDKDIEQVRLQYQSPGLLSSSSESEIKTIRSSDSCISSATLEPKSSSEATGGSQTSISIHSSASQNEISEQEPISSTVSEHNSRGVTPTNPTRSRCRSPRAPVSGTAVSGTVSDERA